MPGRARAPRRRKAVATSTPKAPGPQKQMVQAIEHALFRKYLVDQSGWGILREVSIDDLIQPTRGRKVNRRRIDYLLMRISRRSVPRHERIALEVKVTRADFKRDTDEKRAAWFAVADRFAYVTPKGLIKVEELPPGCGLIEFDPDKPHYSSLALKWKVIAPRKDILPKPFDTQFFAYLLGRASRAESALRGVAA